MRYFIFWILIRSIIIPRFLGIKYQNANNGHIITKICKLES